MTDDQEHSLMGTIYWYSCVECEYVWASDENSIGREWCYNCLSGETPEFLYEEEVPL